jgi:hypothetical protein
MNNKPDDQHSVSHRARRYARGIAVAAVLTFAALLFIIATIAGKAHMSPDALATTERPAPAAVH